jgi:hypothetical protein
VLNKKGQHVATVNVHYSNGGTCTVDVWNIGDKASQRCLAAALSSGAVDQAKLQKTIKDSEAKRDWGTGQDHVSFAAFDLFGLQQGRAGGYGYDRFTAALSGIWIDGHCMADHCGKNAQSEKLLKGYRAAVAASMANPEVVNSSEWRKTWNAKADKIGASFANWSTETNGYMDLYLLDGLRRLEKMGYQVIQAI